jgi:hypothetical protein
LALTLHHVEHDSRARPAMDELLRSFTVSEAGDHLVLTNKESGLKFILRNLEEIYGAIPFAKEARGRKQSPQEKEQPPPSGRFVILQFIDADGRQRPIQTIIEYANLSATGEIGPATLIRQAGNDRWQKLSDFAKTGGFGAGFSPDGGPSFASTPSPLARIHHGYLMRHWFGELSLPVSYWVNGVCLSLAVSVLMSLPIRMDMKGAPIGFALGIIVLGFVSGIWQAVGIWNSAGNHRLRGGHQIWATAARVTVVIGALIDLVSVLRLFR